jgi:stage II sporulation protein M
MGRYHLSAKDDWAYLKSICIFIFLSVFAFSISAVLGYHVAGTDPEFAALQTADLQKLIALILDQPPLAIMIIIFLKNLMTSAMAMLFGVGMGILPLLAAISNGFLLGIVAYGAVQKAGHIMLLAGILPHGIIELPVVLVSIAVGFRLGYLLILTFAKVEADLAGEIRQAVHLLIRYVTPLLFLAAAIETFITPRVISVVT